MTTNLFFIFNFLSYNFDSSDSGVGGFGKVFRGYYRGSEVAVKAATGVANESPELTKDRVLQVNKSLEDNNYDKRVFRT